MRIVEKKCDDCVYYDPIHQTDQYGTGHCRLAPGAPIMKKDSWCEQFKEGHGERRSTMI